MADFRFFLDSVQVTEPKNWESFTIGYVRVLDTRGATIAKPEGDLVFIEDGFDALNTFWNDEGPCGEIPFEITYREDVFSAYATLFEGVIRASDIEFDTENCTATVAQVIDNSYINQINVNGDIKAYPSVTRSKNDQTITAVSTVNIDFFNPNNGAYAFAARPGWQVFDLFTYLVDFCTDGALSFASDFFGAGGDGEGVFIFMGESIRTAAAATPFISFNKLLHEMHVAYNVVVVIDDSGATPVIRVEQAADTYEETVANVFNGEDHRGTKWRAFPFGAGDIPYNGDKPISTFTGLEVGSNTTQDSNGGTFNYPDVQYLGFKFEEYHLLNNCGYKQVLELVNDWIIDSNVIEDVLITSNTAYDENIFIVETDYPAFNRATSYDIFNVGAPPYTYNDGLTNSNKVSRFLGAVPASIALYLGNGNDEFQAELTAATTTPLAMPPRPLSQVAIDFDDDSTGGNYDPNNNYTPGTGLFTCPVGGGGIYSFDASFRFVNVYIDPLGVAPLSYNVTITFSRNAGAETKSQTFNITGDTIVSYAPPSFYLNAGDTMQVNILVTELPTSPSGALNIDQAFFRCTQAENGGGIYQTVDVGNYRGKYYIFERPMSFADFLDFVSYSKRFLVTNVNYTDTSKSFYGWIVQARYKIGQAGGTATIELVSPTEL